MHLYGFPLPHPTTPRRRLELREHRSLRHPSSWRVRQSRLFFGGDACRYADPASAARGAILAAQAAALQGRYAVSAAMLATQALCCTPRRTRRIDLFLDLISPVRPSWAALLSNHSRQCAHRPVGAGTQQQCAFNASDRHHML